MVVSQAMRKIVRFYDLRFLPRDGDDTRPIEPGFWPALGVQIESRSPRDCQVSARGRLVHGEHRTCHQPAKQYFYVGRVRDRPDTLDSAGAVGELELSLRDSVLLEPTYVVPFGTQNRVAVLTMSQSSPRVSTLEDWFSRMAGFDPAIERLTLLPILNQHVAERLAQASGATIFQVHAEPHADIPDGAARSARRRGPPRRCPLRPTSC